MSRSLEAQISVSARGPPSPSWYPQQARRPMSVDPLSLGHHVTSNAVTGVTSPNSQPLSPTSSSRRRAWDFSTKPGPVDLSFKAAVKKWQWDVEQGLYAPKVLRPASCNGVTAAAAGEGHSHAAMGLASDVRTTTRRHGVTRSLACSTGSRTAVHCTGATAAGIGDHGCDMGCSGAGGGSHWLRQPQVFSGAASPALEAFESIVIGSLLLKPHLTLMQLQKGMVTLSELDTEQQLAAVGLMLRGGFWVAAMLISYADWGILAEVLQEMVLLVEAGMQLDPQVGGEWVML